MKKKKNDNNVIYACIIIAVLVLTSFLVYTQTDIFRTRASDIVFDPDDYYIEFYRFGQGWEYPIPPYGDFYDQNTIQYTYGGDYGVGGGYSWFLQSFVPVGDTLSGIGFVAYRGYWGDTYNFPLLIKIADEKPEDPNNYNGWLASGMIYPADLPIEWWCFYGEISPTVEVTPGDTYYIAFAQLQSQAVCWSMSYCKGNNPYPGDTYFWYRAGNNWIDMSAYDFMFFTWTRDCSIFNTEDDCVSPCHWWSDNTCNNYPEPLGAPQKPSPPPQKYCGKFEEQECWDEGCYWWNDHCWGRMPLCEEIDNQYDCEEVWGCIWDEELEICYGPKRTETLIGIISENPYIIFGIGLLIIFSAMGVYYYMLKNKKGIKKNGKKKK
jgi:hypothetical protein